MKTLRISLLIVYHKVKRYQPLTSRNIPTLSAIHPQLMVNVPYIVNVLAMHANSQWSPSNDTSNPSVRARQKWMDGMIERYGTLFETFPSPIKIKKRRFLRENYDDDYLLKSATEAEGIEETHRLSRMKRYRMTICRKPQMSSKNGY